MFFYYNRSVREREARPPPIGRRRAGSVPLPPSHISANRRQGPPGAFRFLFRFPSAPLLPPSARQDSLPVVKRQATGERKASSTLPGGPCRLSALHSSGQAPHFPARRRPIGGGRAAIREGCRPFRREKCPENGTIAAE